MVHMLHAGTRVCTRVRAHVHECSAQTRVRVCGTYTRVPVHTHGHTRMNAHHVVPSSR